MLIFGIKPLFRVGANMNRRLRVSGVLLWMIFVFRLRTVSCQHKVQGFIGEAVLLPCIYQESDPLPPVVNVYWRDKDDKILLDINKNQPDPKTQNQKFKGRVFSFPERYKMGNFSIVVKDAEESDSGLYDCHIEELDVQQIVDLRVSGRRVEAATAGPSGGAVITSTSVHIVLLSLLALLWSGSIAK